MKCVNKEDADYGLKEVKGGICRNHNERMALAQKILWQGIYWPTLKDDAKTFFSGMRVLPKIREHHEKAFCRSH